MKTLISKITTYLVILMVLLIGAYNSLAQENEISLSELRQKVISSDSVAEKIESLSKLIDYYRPRDTDSAIHYLDIYKEYALHDEIEYANYLHGMALYYFYQSNPRKSLVFLDSAKQIYEEADDFANLLSIKNNIANVYMSLAENNKAAELLSENYEYFLRSNKDSLSFSEKTNFVSTLNLLANVYSHFSDYEKTNKLTEEAMYLAYELGDSVRYIINRTNFATESIFLGDTALAIKIFKENIAFKRRNKLLNHYGIEEYKLGGVYAELGMMDSARYFLNQADELGEMYKPDAINVELVKIKLGNIYAKLNEFKKAKEYCAEGYVYAKKVGAKEFLVQACDCLSDVYNFYGNYKKSLAYSKERNIVREEVISAESKKKLLSVESKILWEEQKYFDSLNLVQKNNERDFLIAQQEKDIKRKNWIAAFLLIGLVVLISLSSIIYKLYKKSEQRKAVIKESLEQKEVLLKEIHHRVKNNFQVISSLLNLQTHHIEDEKQLAPIKDAQNRIQSMALVHEKLYQNTDLSSVEMENYFKTLIDSIRTGFSDSDENFKLDLETNSISLDVEKSIPLGLIVNEVLTNSFKYGKSADGIVKVDLSLSKNKGNLSLDISDYGPGFKDEIDLDNLSSLGLELVQLLTEQLNGVLSVKKTKGAGFNISFPA